MWFIPMLIGLYILVPLLRLIERNGRARRIFLFFSVLLASIVPLILGTLSLRFGEWWGSLYILYGSTHIDTVLGYSALFVMGSYLDKSRHPSPSVCFACVVISYCCLFCAVVALSYFFMRPVSILLDSCSPLVIAEAIGMFTWARSMFVDAAEDRYLCLRLRAIGKVCFGVYLIHPMMIDSMERLLEFFQIAIPTLIAIPFLSLAVFVLSTIVSVVIERVPFVSRRVY